MDILLSTNMIIVEKCWFFILKIAVFYPLITLFIIFLYAAYVYLMFVIAAC